MIFRYNQKNYETFSNSKDFYSFHQNKFLNPKNTQRLDHLSNSQKHRQKEASNDLIQNIIQRNFQLDISRHNDTQENPQSQILNSLQVQGQEISQIKEKKTLPPLKIDRRIKHKSRDRNDTWKNSISETPTQGIARKQTLNQKEPPPLDVLQMGRTSSTPFIQKSKEEKADNLTSRSMTPAQDSSTQSPLKNRKIVIKKQQPKVSSKKEEKKPIPKFLDQLDTKKPIVKKKKKPQIQVIAQNPQQDKIIQRHTTYRSFLVKINFSNNQCITSPKQMQVPSYTVYIGKGNNSNLLRLLFRQRWWWQEVDTLDLQKTNMVWTQLKQAPCIEQLYAHNQDTGSINDSFIQSHEETVGDTSDSDLEMKTKSSLIQMKQSVNSNTQRPQNYFALKKILNPQDLNKLMQYMEETKQKDSQVLFSDLTPALLKDIKGVQTICRSESNQYKMHNHMEDNWHLGNKKALFYNMTHYYSIIKEDYTKYMPVTFHVQQGMDDPQYVKFLEYYHKRNDDIREIEKNKYTDSKLYDRKEKRKVPINMWIVKPGELTNRGNGITVCSELSEINKIISEEHVGPRPRTYIVQQYIDNPLLYNKRKFDIRCYMLLTSQNGILKGYWYQEGYIRTSSKEFTTKSTNKFVHLTNDAVQSKGEEYGKFESGNKISFIEFQRYLELTYPQKYYFFADVYPKMKQCALDMIKATYGKIDPHKRTNSFELYGLDFMIDDNFKLFLIEANTNPCLELSCPLLNRIIPTMVENLFRIVIDPIFPPPFIDEWPQNKKSFIPDNLLENNKFELIFDDLLERKSMLNLYKDTKQDNFEIEEEEEEEDEDQND